MKTSRRRDVRCGRGELAGCCVFRGNIAPPRGLLMNQPCWWRGKGRATEKGARGSSSRCSAHVTRFTAPTGMQAVGCRYVGRPGVAILLPSIWLPYPCSRLPAKLSQSTAWALRSPLLMSWACGRTAEHSRSCGSAEARLR